MLLRGVLLWRCVLLWLRVLLRLVLRLVGERPRVLLCVLAILLLVRRLHVLLHDARVDGACLSGPAHACEIQVKAGRGRRHAGRGRVHITSAIRWQTLAIFPSNPNKLITNISIYSDSLHST